MFPCLNILTFNRTFDKSWNDIYEQATYTLAEATPVAIAAGAQYFHAATHKLSEIKNSQ